MFLRVIGCAALCAMGAVALPPTTGSDPMTGSFQIDPVHSTVLFKVQHLGVSNFYGRFNDISGSLEVGEDPADSSLTLTIQTDSVDTNNKDRDNHLRNPDFFNAKQNPKITFQSTSVEEGEDGALQVKGTLKMHGVEKEITAAAHHIGSGDLGQMGKRTGYEARFTLRRSDFGMTNMIGPIGDEIDVIFSLEATLP